MASTTEPKIRFTIALNGVVTYETCPACKTENVKVEHGHDEHGGPCHACHCPVCGTSYPIVCYNCVHCGTTQDDCAHAQ